MKKVAGNQRLIRRKGVYYYRRVPQHLVKKIGKEFIQLSLDTTSLTTAKKRRALRDLEWDARFEDLQKDATPGPKSVNSKPTLNSTPLSEADLLQLVREYVERTDEQVGKRFAADPPQNEREKTELITDAQLGAQIMRDRDDPQADQWIYSAGKEILQAAGKSIDDPDLPHRAALAEWTRRGLLASAGEPAEPTFAVNGRGRRDQSTGPKRHRPAPRHCSPHSRNYRRQHSPFHMHIFS